MLLSTVALRSDESYGNDPIYELTTEMAVRRIPCLAGLTSLYAVACLAVPSLAQQYSLWERVTLVLFACAMLGYACAALRFRRVLVKESPLARAFTFSFWFVLFAGFTPCYLQDAARSSFPLHAILVAALLASAPMYVRFDSLWVFSAFLTLNLALAAGSGAGIRYQMLLVLGASAAFLCALANQRQCVGMLRRLHAESCTDPLTGLLNRKGGEDRIRMLLEVCKRHNQKFMLMMVDIDHFKAYNDTYGHVSGDDALQRVASAMSQAFGRMSDVVCRFGGEEFVICASVSGEEAARDMAESLRVAVEALAIPAPVAQPSAHMTVSIGVSLYTPRPGAFEMNDTTLVAQADQALYDAKGGGRNRVVFYKLRPEK